MTDTTPHDSEIEHVKVNDQILVHGYAWYKFWGGKCPVCNVEAEFGDE